MPSEEIAISVFLNSDETDRQFHFRDTDTIQIGRSPRADVVVQDHRVSRVHSVLTKSKDGWTVQSVGTNPMGVDGVPVRSLEVTGKLIFEIVPGGPHIHVEIYSPVSGTVSARPNRDAGSSGRTKSGSPQSDESGSGRRDVRKAGLATRMQPVKKATAGKSGARRSYLERLTDSFTDLSRYVRRASQFVSSRRAAAPRSTDQFVEALGEAIEMAEDASLLELPQDIIKARGSQRRNEQKIRAERRRQMEANADGSSLIKLTAIVSVAVLAGVLGVVGTVHFADRSGLTEARQEIDEAFDNVEQRAKEIGKLKASGELGHTMEVVGDAYSNPEQFADPDGPAAMNAHSDKSSGGESTHSP